MAVREEGLEDVDWIHQSRGGDRWRDLVNSAESSGSIKDEEFLD
jgi:hypothetical protein